MIKKKHTEANSHMPEKDKTIHRQIPTRLLIGATGIQCPSECGVQEGGQCGEHVLSHSCCVQYSQVDILGTLTSERSNTNLAFFASLGQLR